MSTKTILASDVDTSVEIAERKYDGKFLVWRKMVSFDENIDLTTFWEIIGVYDDFHEARRQKDRYRIIHKTGN